MKILYYAFGGGAGHLVRALAVLRELREHDCFVITNSSYSHIASKEGIVLFKIPGDYEAPVVNKTSLIKEILNVIKPELLIVDTFYYGYYGELEEYILNPKMKKVFIFRKRCDEENHPDLSCYDLVILPNTPDDGLRSPLLNKKNFYMVGYMVCRKPEEIKSAGEAFSYLRVFFSSKKIILAIHCGYKDEGEKIFSYIFSVFSDLKLKNVILRFASINQLEDFRLSPYHINYFPVVELLKPVDLVIAGGGYNTYREITMAGKKRIVIPLERKLDDQKFRIKNEKYIFTDKKTLKKVLLPALEDTSPFVPSPDLFMGAVRLAIMINSF